LTIVRGSQAHEVDVTLAELSEADSAPQQIIPIEPEPEFLPGE
jgi:hypothetical protein